MRELARVSSAAGLPFRAGTDALAPRAPTPNAGAARVLGRAPRPRTSAPRRAHDRPYGIPGRRPRLGDTGRVAVDVSVPLPGADPGRFLRSKPDEALVELVRGGHEAAFEALYDRHHRGLLAFCRHMLGSREEGEDALQHTFAAAYRALTGAGQRPRALKPWLYAIARNRCISVRRARRPNEAAPACDEEADAPVVLDGLADAVQRRDDLRDLVADIHRLPDDQRAALVLFELGDHSHAEIAAVLSIDRAKVKALVFQAREGLLRARTARDTPCAEIRRHLSSRTRVMPRRGVVRGHLDRCPACAAYDLEVRGQRSALALALPVLPSLELKDSVLGPLLGGGASVAGGGAVVAGSAAGGGGGAGAAGAAGGAGATGAGAAGGAGAAAAGAGGATASGAGAAGASGAAAAGGGAPGGSGAAAAGASGGFAGIGAAGGFAGVGAAGGLGALAAKAVVAKVVTIVAVAGGAAGVHHAARPTHHAHRHAASRSAAASVAPFVAPAGAIAAARPVAAPAAARPGSATPASLASAPPTASGGSSAPAAGAASQTG